MSNRKAKKKSSVKKTPLMQQTRRRRSAAAGDGKPNALQNAISGAMNPVGKAMRGMSDAAASLPGSKLKTQAQEEAAAVKARGSSSPAGSKKKNR